MRNINNQILGINVPELLTMANKLPEPYLSVIRFYYQDDLSVVEISKRMDIPVYRAKNILSKALYLIKKQSGDSEYEKAKRILYHNEDKPLK